MLKRVEKKIGEIESLRFASVGLSNLHAAVMSQYAYTYDTAISDEAIEAALFGEQLNSMRRELSNVEHINSTSRKTQRTTIREFELNRDIGKLMSKKSGLMSRYKKTIREYDVDFIKFVDSSHVSRHCVALCQDSANIAIDRMVAKVGKTRQDEERVRRNASIVGLSYKKSIPDDTDDEN